MTRVTGTIVVLTCVVLLASSALRARPQWPVNEPGQPTLARMVVINGRDQAVPVVLQAGGEMQPVTLVGTPTVTIAADNPVQTRTARQGWDYRIVDLSSSQASSDALDTAGAEGWEAVGVTQGSAGAMRVLLKRPR